MDDDDRIAFLELLDDVVGDYGWQLPAYVLMSNHYHLLFLTPQPNLSRGMQDLDGKYASTFNARHRRVGHLFQGRFKSHVVDSEAYLLAVARYIVLNPVRAGMVASAGEWRWSSYRATAGLDVIPSWLDPAPILERVDVNGYREYVAAGAEAVSRPWENRAAPTPIESIKEALSPWPPASGSDERAAFVILATRLGIASQAEIGRHLGITGQAVGLLLRKTQARLKVDDNLNALIHAAGGLTP